jgi:hypothetical protein
MDKIATSRAEADSELEWLRKERGFEGQNQANPTLVSFLDNALNMSVIAILVAETESVLTAM